MSDCSTNAWEVPETAELLPCPFCGGGAEVCEGGINGKMRVYGLVKHKDGCFFLADGLPTKYQHIMESGFDAWNTRAERTCHVIASYSPSDMNDEAEWYLAFSCGHELYWDEPEPPDHCPECGAKIRKAVGE